MSTQAHTSTPAEPGCLVEIIELKWLLAGHGVRVHVEMLQHDREYARRTLDRAESMPNRTLQEVALKLRIALGLTAC